MNLSPLLDPAVIEVKPEDGSAFKVEKQSIQEFGARRSQADHKKMKDVHQVERSEHSVEQVEEFQGI